MVYQASVRERLDLPAAADPAWRDIEEPWAAGRFAERVRRTWNQVRTATIDGAGDDLDRLAHAIHGITGDDEAKVRARLEEFWRAERLGRVRPDPLLHPGAGLPSEERLT